MMLDKRSAKNAVLTIKRLAAQRRARRERVGLNLNIGSGNYTIASFVSLDLSTDWYGRGRNNFVEYNMITDDLPYGNAVVDNIYCSHVVEHLPDEPVDKFLKEAHRVLKPGGVLRIVCPDTEFLWNVSSFDNGYWAWRKPWFGSKLAKPTEPAERRRSDFFVREVATPSCRLYTNRRRTLDYDDTMFDRDYRASIDTLQEGLSFDARFPGDHINAWDFDKVRTHGEAAGFRRIVHSKAGGSVSAIMQHADFDKTQPMMSLYVDLVKTAD